jgi:hypothetical protein
MTREIAEISVERLRLCEMFFPWFTANLVPFAASLCGLFTALKIPFLHAVRIGRAVIIAHLRSESG